MYKFDKSAFKIQTVQEADHNRAYWMEQSPAERLKAAWYLTCCIHRLDPEKEHSLDKSVFSMRKRTDG